jgi:hypothetical protein
METEGKANHMFRDRSSGSKKLFLRGAWLAVGICLSTFAVSPLRAQTDQGAIGGVVQDESGAVIPGAKVTLTATDTSFALERTANESGAFTFTPVKICTPAKSCSR